MTLFLTSSPCVPGADRAILNPANGFLDRLRQVVAPGARGLVICSDPEDFYRTEDFARSMAQAFWEAGLPFGALATLDGRNREEAAAHIRESDLILLAGGHVPTQNRFFREIGLGQLLRGYEGVVLGVSAGSMNCAAMVYAHPELPGEAVDPAYRRFLPGLGLTYLNLIPHYQQIRDDVLDGLKILWDIAQGDSFGHTFYLLPDGSYFWIREGQTWLCGEAYQMEEGHCRQVCREGETRRL